MSKYTTGEIAKLCGVTVRTVQYYNTRGILMRSQKILCGDMGMGREMMEFENIVIVAFLYPGRKSN